MNFRSDGAIGMDFERDGDDRFGSAFASGKWPTERVLSGINSYMLLAVPFFIFAAVIMNRGERQMGRVGAGWCSSRTRHDRCTLSDSRFQG